MQANNYYHLAEKSYDKTLVQTGHKTAVGTLAYEYQDRFDRQILGLFLSSQDTGNKRD
jgi:hypothetical protein